MILLMATRNPTVENHRLDGAKTLVIHGINYQPGLDLNWFSRHRRSSGCHRASIISGIGTHDSDFIFIISSSNL